MGPRRGQRERSRASMDHTQVVGKRLSNPPVIPGDLMLKLVHERKAGGSSGTVAQPCGSGSIGRRVRSERAHATGVLYEARVVIGNAGSVSETTAAAG